MDSRTIEQSVSSYLSLKKTSWADNSSRSIKSILIRYSQKYDELSRDNISKFIMELLEGGVKTRSIEAYCTHLKRFAEYLADEDLLTYKEYRKIKQYSSDHKSIKKAKPRYLEEKIVAELIKKLQSYEMLRHIFFAGLHLGLRAEGYTLLELNDIDKERGSYGAITVREKGKGQEKKERLIPLTYESSRWLDGYLRFRLSIVKSEDEQAIFPSNRGGSVSTRTIHLYYQEITEIAIKHDLLKNRKKTNITAHDMRHTCSKRLQRLGYSEQSIQLFLGHSSIDTTTKIYLHKTDEELLEAFSR